MIRYAPSVEESAELAGLALSAAFEPYVKEKHGVEFLRLVNRIIVVMKQTKNV